MRVVGVHNASTRIEGRTHPRGRFRLYIIELRFKCEVSAERWLTGAERLRSVARSAIANKPLYAQNVYCMC
jgi:hypothetical protein